jgi:hypothetical protein
MVFDLSGLNLTIVAPDAGLPAVQEGVEDKK